MSHRYSKDPRVDSALRHSIKDGVSYSVMTGAGESYFAAFALYLKASTAQIGVLASLPPLLASFAQLLSSWLGRRWGRRRNIIVLGASVQGAALIPLGVLPLLFPDQALPILVACAVLYLAGSNLAVPQWGSLMGDLVPERRRGRYFARRTRLCSVASFCGLIGAGVILDLFDRNAWTMAGYLVIFGIATAARAVSIYHLLQMHDPPGHVAALESPFGVGFWRRVRGSSFVRFSAFFAAISFAVSICSPFFVVYQLRDLQFSYLEYTVSIAVVVLAQFLTLNRWGRISDAFGNRFILVATGLIIPFLPSLWLVSTNYLYILLLQALGGLFWAGFSLSAGNYLYDLIPGNKRAMYLAFHNVLASVAVFCGAMVGAYLGTHLPREAVLFGTHYEWLSVLYGVFLISTLARLLVAVLFLPQLKEMRTARAASVGGVIFRVARLQPLSELIFDIISPRRRRKTPSEAMIPERQKDGD
ncbi:MAG: MFS transporter [Gammaproteobacteria bacterium]|nr:MFS transporter [Gammaproteobacteria bacterium]